MHRFLSLAAFIIVLFLALGSLAQSPIYPRVTLVLPSGVPSETIDVQYYLYGSFGAFGGYVTARPDAQTYEIHAAVGDKPASQFKGFVWGPGCKMATFDIPVERLSDVRETFSCVALPTTTLSGRIQPMDLVRGKPAEIAVTYVASWACKFFKLADCMVPQFSIGTVKPDADGTFEMEIPDFGADPIANDATLSLVLRETKTWNPIADLEPKSIPRSGGQSLRVAKFYPRDLVFVARKAN